MLPININFSFFRSNNYEGIHFFIAILCGIIYLKLITKKKPVNHELLYEAIFVSLISAIITGRLFSLFFWSFDEIIADPLLIFKVWEGGITVTGGVIGGIIAGFIYAKIKKLNFIYYIQYIIPAIFVGQIVGRFGCFLNGDASGSPTSMPWGVVFHPESVAYYFNGISPGTPLHPTQIYEIIGNLILFIAVILTGNNKWITSRRIIWYCMGYGLIRFIVEFFRNDTERWPILPAISTGQIISLSGLIVGLVLLILSFIFAAKFDYEIPSESNHNEENGDISPTP